MMWTDIVSYLLSGAAGGGIALYLCKSLGEKWIEKWINARFEERLASFKHEQQKEIETLRLRINTLMDRMTKLHQREFDVLPEAWGRMIDATIKIQGLAHRFDPNLDALPEERLDEFLSGSPLTPVERQQVKAATDKTKFYASRVVVHSFSDAITTFNEFSLYLRKNGIFIERALRSKFDEIEKLMVNALTEQHLNIGRHHDQPLAWKWEKVVALEEEGKVLTAALDKAVQSRLWSADSLLDAKPK